ncbi:hypothetical protein BVX94_02590, partial [bacterium B17]
ADYIGFVLYPSSPRGIGPLAMARVLDRLEFPYKVVPVFVNTPRSEVEKIAADCDLHAVQIHGDEEAAEFEDMPVSVWRAVKMVDGECAPDITAWKAERYVVDAAVSGQYGGTGEKADWVAARELATKVPVMLAGGLVPENIAEAVKAVEPLGVDVASGVEYAPGLKDHKKIEDFIKGAR